MGMSASSAREASATAGTDTGWLVVLAAHFCPLRLGRSIQTRYTDVMMTARYVYWQDGKHWLGYFEEFPDYMTQGDSLDDLREHLKDLYDDLTGDAIRGIRRVAELSLSS